MIRHTSILFTIAAGIISAILVAVVMTTATSPPRAAMAARQQSQICSVAFSIETSQTLEAPAGQSVTVPFRASITVMGVDTAYVSIFVGIPLNIQADYSPAEQVIAVQSPTSISTYNVMGNIDIVVPENAKPGQSWTFRPNSATITCETTGSGAALQDIDSDPGFRLIAQAAIATSTPVPTNTPVPTATSTPAPTFTPIPTPTSVPTPTATSTATATPTPTFTPVPTSTPTASPTPAPSATSTSQPTQTATAEPTASPTMSATATVRPSPSATTTAEPSKTPTPTATTNSLPSGTPTAEVQTAPTPPGKEATATPPSGEPGLKLELHEVRASPRTAREGSRTSLRAGIGLLGVIALVSGTISIWRGTRGRS